MVQIGPFIRKLDRVLSSTLGNVLQSWKKSLCCMNISVWGLIVGPSCFLSSQRISLAAEMLSLRSLLVCYTTFCTARWSQFAQPEAIALPLANLQLPIAGKGICYSRQSTIAFSLDLKSFT